MIEQIVESYFKNVTQEQFIADLKKANCLHLVDGVKIEKERPAKFKNKYEAMNFINEKYDVIPYEITCYDEANEFWNDLCSLANMGKIADEDFNLASKAMDTF